MSEQRDTLYKRFIQDTNPRYPSGREGWETYLIDRIAELEWEYASVVNQFHDELAHNTRLEAVAEAAVDLQSLYDDSVPVVGGKWDVLEDALRAAGYLGVGE